MIFREFLYLHKLKGNLRLKPLELEELQRKKLTAIVRQAYENVPFYHKKLRQAGIKPDDIKTLSDMQKIPITTRNELQSSSLKDLVASNVNPNTLIKETTSGSTGIPLTTFFSQKVKDFDRGNSYQTFFL